MKIGIGLPNMLPFDLQGELVLEWARLADEAGFHSLAVTDKPNYDSWDPLVTLAGVAGVTKKIRLATTILQLPNRNEVLVAKQASVVDRLSAGRLDLGVGLGARRDDYEVFATPFAGRARRFESQIDQVRSVWARAQEATADVGTLGPAPVQFPGPPIWIGAMTDRAIARATRLGDGYIFGATRRHMIPELVGRIRAMAAAGGREDFRLVALLYVAVGKDEARARHQATRQLGRYFAQPPASMETLLVAGPREEILAALAVCENNGIDLTVMLPQIPELAQVDQLADIVLS